VFVTWHGRLLVGAVVCYSKMVVCSLLALLGIFTSACEWRKNKLAFKAIALVVVFLTLYSVDSTGD
jgi:hypothetical protein